MHGETDLLCSPSFANFALASHYVLGDLGQIAAERWFQQSGFQVISRNEPWQPGHDLVIATGDGQQLRVEVKTARRGKDGYQFILYKKGKTSIANADLVMLIAVGDSGKSYTFLIPAGHIRHLKKIDITSHPLKYRGKYARYLQPANSLKWGGGRSC